MKIEVLVDAPVFWDKLRADILSAKKSVLVQAMTFEADTAGLALADTLLAAKAPERRVMLDCISTYMVSDQFFYKPRNYKNPDLRAERAATFQMVRDLNEGGVRVRWIHPLGPAMVRILARNHKKIMVIDKHVCYIGGINFSDHNFGWHDMMLRVESAELAAVLTQDFMQTWDDKPQSVTHRLAEMDVFLCAGRDNPRQFDALFELVKFAEREIFIESTYFTTPFFEKLRAVNPDVKITLLTSEINNWSQMRDYIPWAAARSNVELRVYPDRLTHLKAMLIDNKFLIVGSSNFEFLSYNLYHELVAVVKQPETIAAFREKVMLPDLQISLPYQAPVRPVMGKIRDVQFKAIGRLSRLWNYF